MTGYTSLPVPTVAIRSCDLHTGVCCHQVKISAGLQWKKIHQRSPLLGLELQPGRCVLANSKLNPHCSSVRPALRLPLFPVRPP